MGLRGVAATSLLLLAGIATARPSSLASADLLPQQQQPLVAPVRTNASFEELKQLALLADIAYCVAPGNGISKPFKCASHCDEFPSLELVTSWNTGAFLSDSSGYIAVDNENSSGPRVYLVFRGTYSIADAVRDLATIPQEYIPYNGTNFVGGAYRETEHSPKCIGCTVHGGFYDAWQQARGHAMAPLKRAMDSHPNAQLHIVGHSLGGVSALFSALELHAHHPIVTTFGEPRAGNAEFVAHVDEVFGQDQDRYSQNSMIEPLDDLKYRRVTHLGDPVPLLPLAEWGFSSHSTEIFINKTETHPDPTDLVLCDGDEDPECAASTSLLTPTPLALQAHRSYFTHLGICLPA